MNRPLLTRKRFLVNSGIAMAGLFCRPRPPTCTAGRDLRPFRRRQDRPRRLIDIPDFPEHDPQIDRARVKRFVIAGHFNLPAVEEMLARRSEP